MPKHNPLQGNFRAKNGRWYWTVKLPGEEKFVSRPMVPIGSRFATTNEAAAREIARDMWDSAMTLLNNRGREGWDGTVGCLARLFLQHTETYYRRKDGSTTSQVRNTGHALAPLLDTYSGLPCEKFGPLKLHDVRDAWIKAGLCRTTINSRVWTIKNAFTWAASLELISPSVAAALQTVKGLHQGRSEAKESRTVEAVEPEIVQECMKFMTPVQATMVNTQMRTGMRSSEVCWMAPKYLDRSKPVWIYNVDPRANKNAWRGKKHERRVPLVPEVQSILLPYLLRDPESFCFQPAESEKQFHDKLRAERKTGLRADGTPSSNMRRDAGRQGQKRNDQYDADGYRKFIIQATKKANKARLEAVKKELGGPKVNESGADRQRLEGCQAAKW